MQDKSMLSRSVPGICGNMLHMLTNITVLHIQNAYFEFARTAYASRASEMSKSWHMQAVQIQNIHFEYAAQ